MCDTITAVNSATGRGEVLFGKNSDREYDEAQYLEWIPAATHASGTRLRLTHVEIAQATETYAVLLSKPHWIWGAEIGANEHGLAIGNEAIFSTTEASLADGIIGMDYLRLALERARTTDEGVAVITTLLKQHGQSGNCGFRRPMSYHNAYIIADPHSAVVLETVDREWAVQPIADYYAISNAMTIDSFRSEHEDASKNASGVYRRARATELLSERNGQLQLTDFFNVLRDHREGSPAPGRPAGPRICAHLRDYPLGQTTASWVSTLTPSKQLHWVTGTAAPCTGLYKPVEMTMGLPAHGSRPGAEPDNTSLWWRHERLRRYLDASDASLQRQFMSERDRLENSFLRSVDAAESREDLRHVIAACWREALEFESRWLAGMDG